MSGLNPEPRRRRTHLLTLLKHLLHASERSLAVVQLLCAISWLIIAAHKERWAPPSNLPCFNAHAPLSQGSRLDLDLPATPLSLEGLHRKLYDAFGALCSLGAPFADHFPPLLGHHTPSCRRGPPRIDQKQPCRDGGVRLGQGSLRRLVPARGGSQNGCRLAARSPRRICPSVHTR